MVRRIFVDLDDEFHRIHLGTFIPDLNSNGGEGRDMI